MTAFDEKDAFRLYLQTAREVMLWKLDGVGEYDARRPLVPTGTNLLGLVKHLAGVEIGYFGATFGRPFAAAPAWASDPDEDIDPVVDMFATADESREEIVGLYRAVWAHSDATIAALDLDAAGRVPHWPPERRDVTLQRILLHVIAETNRHAGHADLVRELVDGAAGHRAAVDNLPDGDAAWWAATYARVERAARDAVGSGAPDGGGH